MKKLVLGLLAVSTLLSVSLLADAVNGVEIYKSGRFPEGKTIQLDELSYMNEGKQDRVIYLEAPMKFKDAGVPNGKGGFTYTAKVNRTWVGGFVSKFSSPKISSAVFKITIPYKSTLRTGDAYSFKSDSPLKVISKENKMGSDTKYYQLYTCIYEGYLNFKSGSTYPTLSNEVPKPETAPKK